MEEWEEEVLQTKVLPALYRAKEFLKRDRYDSAYNEIEDAIAVIANRLLPELDLIDLDQIRVLALDSDEDDEEDEERKEGLKECMREFHTAIEFIDDCIRICREGEKVKEGEKQDYVRVAKEYAEQAFLQLCEVEKVCKVSILSAKKHIDNAINELNTTKDLTIAGEFMMIAREKLWDLR